MSMAATVLQIATVHQHCELITMQQPYKQMVGLKLLPKTMALELKICQDAFSLQGF